MRNEVAPIRRRQSKVQVSRSDVQGGSCLNGAFVACRSGDDQRDRSDQDRATDGNERDTDR